MIIDIFLSIFIIFFILFINLVRFNFVSFFFVVLVNLILLLVFIVVSCVRMWFLSCLSSSFRIGLFILFCCDCVVVFVLVSRNLLIKVLSCFFVVVGIDCFVLSVVMMFFMVMLSVRFFCCLFFFSIVKIFWVLLC